MTLPEGVQPSGPTDPVVTPEPVSSTESVSSEVADGTVLVDDPATAVDESASDAELRAWARDNGLTGVPTGGRLSAAWREQIVTAMAAALDPKEEASAEPSPTSDSSTPVTTGTTTVEMTVVSSTGEETSLSTEKTPVQPEFAHGGEYRSVFYAPNTFVSSQTFTA